MTFKGCASPNLRLIFPVSLLGELTDLGRQVSRTTARLRRISILTLVCNIVNLPFWTQSPKTVHRQVSS